MEFKIKYSNGLYDPFEKQPWFQQDFNKSKVKLITIDGRQPIWWKNSLRQPSLYSTILHYYRKTNLKKRKGLCFYKSALLTSCGLQTTVLRKYLNVLDTNNLYKVLWEKNRFVRQSNDTLIYWNWFSWRKCFGFHSLHTVSLTKEQAAVTCKVPFQTKELAKDVKLILKFSLEERINCEIVGDMYTFYRSKCESHLTWK
jgi:hypothetical protein